MSEPFDHDETFDMDVPPDTLVPNSKLNNKYKLIEKLGQGGMGEVWKALDLNVGRFVALKFAHDKRKPATEQIRKSFARASSLRHSSICPHYSLEDNDKLGYYAVMLYLEGETLESHVERKYPHEECMPFNQVIDILSKVAGALDEAHQSDVIHCDIKPENIFLAKQDGQYNIQVIDFGLAERSGRQKQGGTPTCMAPEQWDNQELTGATDQYALACVAYKLLSGHFPFEGNDAPTIRSKVMQDTPQSIDTISSIANDTLQKALAKKAEDRFGSCKKFIDMLNRKAHTTSELSKTLDWDDVTPPTLPLPMDNFRSHDSSDFLAIYKKQVEETYAVVKLLQFVAGYEEEAIVPVQDIYVDLKYEPFRFAKTVSTADIFRCRKSCEELVCTYKDERRRKENMNMVILGLPGAGKSTLLKYLLYKYNHDKNVIPVYIELKGDKSFKSYFMGSDVQINLEQIRAYIKDYVERIAPAFSKEIYQQITDSTKASDFEFIFFCDGLDEISRAEYKKFTKAVNDICTFRGHRVIISSREIGFSEKDYQGFKLFSLLDFDDHHQTDYIHKYYDLVYAADEDTDKELRKNLLISLINTNDTISKLAKSPILLSLLCVTKNINNVKNKAQLFKEAIKILLQNRQISDEDSQVRFIDFLKELAVIFFKLDQAECFEHGELEFYANKFFCREDDAICSLLKQKYLDCGLFDKSSKDGTYKFTHRTIWEYLVAEGMVARDKNEVYNRANTGLWEEPIKMYVTLIDPNDVNSVLEGIWRQNKALALRCMIEFENFPRDIFNRLYGGLKKRDKLRLIATLRESYTTPSSEYRKQIVNVIRDTLVLIHKAENDAKDCEVIYSYIEFLEEFKEQEPVFNELITEFLDLDNARNRRTRLQTEFGLKFVRIPSGEFYMGRNPIRLDEFSEEDKKNLIYIDSEEVPSHKVHIKNDFYMSQTLVTNEMYYKSGFPYADLDRLSNNPYSDRDKQPVNKVNWFEAIVFAKWLGCTLPTEAEWEYACTGAEKDYENYITLNSGKMIAVLDKVACYSKNSQNKTRAVFPVDSEKTNSLSLLDMLGNLREWCLDWYSDDFYSLCMFDKRRFPNFDCDIKGKPEVTYDSSGNLIMDDDAYNGDTFTFNVNEACVNPVKKEPGKFEAKCLRGGCFDWNHTNLRPTYRNNNPASNVYKVNGFRLVKNESID